MSRAFWTSAFLDLAPDDLDRGTRFWAAVTGYDAARVADQSVEFPPLRPPTGAPYLWVQRVGEGPSRVHLDLHVDDLDEHVATAEGLGAQLLERRDHAVLSSPCGFVFCLVTEAAGDVPAPDHGSRVDRVRLFVPPDRYADEHAFWARLQPAPPRPLEVVVERGEDLRPRAVLEVGTDARHAEVIRHVQLGADVVDATAAYDELVDPVGIWYRIADRKH